MSKKVKINFSELKYVPHYDMWTISGFYNLEVAVRFAGKGGKRPTKEAVDLTKEKILLAMNAEIKEVVFE